MLGVKGSGDKKKKSAKELEADKVRKRKIRLSVLIVIALVLATYLGTGALKSGFASFSKDKLQQFVTVWKPIEDTNEATIEMDIQTLNTETLRIKEEVVQKHEPINSKKLKAEIVDFFDYANAFTSDMHRDFQWSKDLSEISASDDKAISAIDFNNGSGPLGKSLAGAISVLDSNIAKMDAMEYSPQVSEAHKQFRDSVAEESALFSRLLSAVKTNDPIAVKNAGTEIEVFNEKFGKMSGPSSALTIAYAIKTKEFEIKIERLGKKLDYASNIMINNLF